MYKKIRVEQLQLGMYIKEFCGSWMEHPFWRTSFLLDDPKDLEDLRACSIREVWIDTDKGLDLPDGEEAPTLHSVAHEVEQRLAQAQSAPPAPKTVSLEEEIGQATKIYNQSKKAVYSMFQEARMGRAVDAEKARQMVEDISSSVMRNPGALISLARLKNADEYTYMHSVAVCALMIALARQLGLSPEETREAGVAGLLHDLGKAVIPHEILNKPGKLTDTEFAIMKTHPVEGHRMLLAGYKVGEIALDVCLHHHEKINGTGYPEGLKADQISLYAKMGAVCDVYDAITSNRPYKPGWNPAESLHKMAEWAPSHFDDHIFQAFVKSVGIYPIGSFVRLTSGRMGVVIEQNEHSLLVPRVKVFYSAKARAFIPPEVVDLALLGGREKIIGREEPHEWGIRAEIINAMWSGLDTHETERLTAAGKK